MSTDDTLARTLLIIVAVVLLAPLLVMVFMMPMMGLWGGGHMWGGGMWDGSGATWAWLLMWLLPFLVVLGLGYLLYETIRRPGVRETDTALEELRIAYARGELSQEEFEERRERLERGT